MAHRYGRREFSAAVRQAALRRAVYRCERCGTRPPSDFITAADRRCLIASCCAASVIRRRCACATGLLPKLLHKSLKQGEAGRGKVRSVARIYLTKCRVLRQREVSRGTPSRFSKPPSATRPPLRFRKPVFVRAYRVKPLSPDTPKTPLRGAV
jgi:hypothetical protein